VLDVDDQYVEAGVAEDLDDRRVGQSDLRREDHLAAYEPIFDCARLLELAVIPWRPRPGHRR
jgi:hypothetical protein